MIGRRVVFDAYGTLLDVHGAMQRHAETLAAGLGAHQRGVAGQAARIHLGAQR